jgi:hypothetical protein
VGGIAVDVVLTHERVGCATIEGGVRLGRCEVMDGGARLCGGATDRTTEVPVGPEDTAWWREVDGRRVLHGLVVLEIIDGMVVEVRKETAGSWKGDSCGGQSVVRVPK